MSTAVRRHLYKCLGVNSTQYNAHMTHLMCFLVPYSFAFCCETQSLQRPVLKGPKIVCGFYIPNLNQIYQMTVDLNFTGGNICWYHLHVRHFLFRVLGVVVISSQSQITTS
jgi:hypothetical protein